MQLFFSDNISLEGGVLAEDESRHALKVMRLSQGAGIFVTNGRGQLFSALISAASKDGCLLTQVKEIPPPSVMTYRLHLAVSPVKNHDRFEWFLEKATEIGVSEITPLICRRSERNKINTQRAEKIIIAAAKQSLTLDFPKLNEACYFDEFIAKITAAEKYMAVCTPGAPTALLMENDNYADSLVMIGPEGDFTEQEMNAAAGLGFRPLSLGNKRLRTETAAVTACAQFHFLNMTK